MNNVVNFNSPVGNIHINNYEYIPKEDITAYEVGVLINFFFCAQFATNIAVEEFIKENGLERHFRKDE